MSSIIYLLEQTIMEEVKHEKQPAETPIREEEKKGGVAEMEIQAVVETIPKKEVRNEAVVRVLEDQSRSFTEKMDAVNNLFKRGKIPFEVFFETISGLAETHREVEKIKRDIETKEHGIEFAQTEIRTMQDQESRIREVLNQETLRSLREVITRAVSETPTLEDVEATLTAGIAEVVIRSTVSPEKSVGGLNKGMELAAQANERIQELKQEIRRDAELKRLERLHQKAMEHIPTLAKSVEDVDKSEVLSILDDYFLTEKEQLAKLGLTEPEIVFIRKRAVSLLKEWLTAWKDVLSEEDKNEISERIGRLPMEVLRRTLKEVLQ